jgi:importin-4
MFSFPAPEFYTIHISPLQSALLVIDALATKLPPTQVFPALHALIVQYFTSLDPANRRGAILALGVCVEGCSEHMNPLINDIWPLVEAGLIDSDASVRRATCSTVGFFCEWFEDFCVSKHDVLVPVS